MEMEQIIMELVVNGGMARSLAIEAIRNARQGNFDEACKLMKESAETLSKAHEVQTELITKEAGGEHMEVQLLMVHAQDHVMNAMTVYDLAVEIIELLKERK